MRIRKFFLCSCFAVSLAVCGCRTGVVDSRSAAAVESGRGNSSKPGSVVRVNLVIRGMHCTGCASGIRSELMQTAGVNRAKVDFRKGEARVDYDPSMVGVDRLIRVVAEAGYQAAEKKR